MQSFTFYVALHNQSSPVLSAPLRASYDRSKKSCTGRYASYPAGTKAFLYYCVPLGKPRIAGELRLRVTSSDDPASFESGSDLLGLNGQPWTRPLRVLPKYYTPLYEKLREDHLVPDDLHAVLSTFPPRQPRYYGPQLLYTLSDTLIVDFGAYGQYFYVITEQGMVSVQFSGPFSEKRPLSRRPYTGAYTPSPSTP